jgi:hypothetical protein
MRMNDERLRPELVRSDLDLGDVADATARRVDEVAVSVTQAVTEGKVPAALAGKRPARRGVNSRSGARWRELVVPPPLHPLAATARKRLACH